MAFKLFDEDFATVRQYTDADTRAYRKAIDYLMGVSQKYRHTNDAKRSAYNYTLGLYHSKIGDYKTADSYFNIAVAHLSGRYQIAIEMATSYLQRGALKEANDILEELEKNRGIQHSSICRLFFMMKSRYHLLSGDYASALHFAQEANRLDRNPHPTPIKETGLAEQYVREDANPLEGAFAYALNLLSIDKKSDPRFRLSYTFLENFMKSRDNPEEKLECLIALSRFAEELDDLKRAKIYLDRAITLSPHNAELRAERIRLSCESLQPDEALKLYNQDKNLIRAHQNATIEVADTFNKASQNHSFGDLTRSFASIAASLTKHLSKQKEASAPFCTQTPAFY